MPMGAVVAVRRSDRQERTGVTTSIYPPRCPSARLASCGHSGNRKRTWQHCSGRRLHAKVRASAFNAEGGIRLWVKNPPFVLAHTARDGEVCLQHTKRVLAHGVSRRAARGGQRTQRTCVRGGDELGARCWRRRTRRTGFVIDTKNDLLLGGLPRSRSRSGILPRAGQPVVYLPGGGVPVGVGGGVGDMQLERLPARDRSRPRRSPHRI
jgi:hypothetical protein